VLLSVGLVGVVFCVLSITVLNHWQRVSAQSDEGLSREVRPVVAAMDENSLLITVVAASIREANPQISYIDLIDPSTRHQTVAEDVAAVNARVDESLRAGQNVYYLYSHAEADTDVPNNGQPYRPFFDSLSSRHRIDEVFQTSSLRIGKYPWIIYQIMPEACSAHFVDHK
jgi:hypothetical protein